MAPGLIGTIQAERYRILRKLGEGGMGEVYLAEHVSLGRRDALKILHAELATDPRFISRFRREARATNRLSHPNIVAVYDFGRLDDGRFFLAMELAEGDPLSTLLRSVGAFGPQRAMSILGQLADAAHHAHERGVIHRDLKPENLILLRRRSQSETLKVLDFGLAKIVNVDPDMSSSVSERGQVFGTPRYMSPEAFAQLGVDPRSDIYAIGCIGFELLTGAAPFDGRPLEVMHAHMRQAPERPSKRRPGAAIPDALERIVLRCLEKDPAARFQTGRDLFCALQEVPGFHAVKTGRGRLGRSSVASTAEFGGGDTMIDPSPGRAGIATAPEAHTEPVPPEVVRGALHRTLCELAESCIDLGFDDLRLVMDVASLKALGDDLHRIEQEMTSLQERADRLEQAAREREGGLRFALGELAFGRSQAATRQELPCAELDRQIASLEERLVQLATDLERQGAELTDRAIALAAERSRIEEQLDALYVAIEHLLEQMLARSNQDNLVRGLLERLRNVHGLIQATQQPTR